MIRSREWGREDLTKIYFRMTLTFVNRIETVLKYIPRILYYILELGKLRYINLTDY